MTTASSAVATHGVAAENRPAWPAADTVVLRSRTIQAGTPDARLSRFSDAVWVLQPAHADAHHVVNSVHWSRFPPALVLPFKAFALAALDHPYPQDLMVERSGERMAIDTIGSRLRDLRVFAEWMGDRDLDRVSAVTDRWLDAYRAHVLALAKSAKRKAELLGAVRILWAYRDHLPGAARVATANP